MAQLLRSSQLQMPSLNGAIADERHVQSVPFRFRFHRKSGPWNPSSQPLLLATDHRVSPRMSQRFPRTSKSVDFLSQREVFYARSLFGPFAIVDVGSGPVPTDHLSSL